jgi:hypothetical protein
LKQIVRIAAVLAGAAAAVAIAIHSPVVAHYVAVGSPTLLTNAITKRSTAYTEITPIAILFSEYIVLARAPKLRLTWTGAESDPGGFAGAVEDWR